MLSQLLHYIHHPHKQDDEYNMKNIHIYTSVIRFPPLLDFLFQYATYMHAVAILRASSLNTMGHSAVKYPIPQVFP